MNKEQKREQNREYDRQRREQNRECRRLKWLNDQVYRLRGVWHNMKNRCGNTKRKQYPDYGGRGIKVCERWLDCFDAFRDDLLALYEAAQEQYGRVCIDRIDNDGNYYNPVNVRFVPLSVSNRNKRAYGAIGYVGVSFVSGQP